MKKLIRLVYVAFAFAVLASWSEAQSNSKSGEIPKDLVITLSRSTDVYKISSDGTIHLDTFSPYLPINIPIEIPLCGQKLRLKPLKLKNRVSKNQLRRLISKFESSGFYTMNDNHSCEIHLKENYVDMGRSSLSITANGKTQTVTYDQCRYSKDSPLTRFLALYDSVSAAMKGIRVIVKVSKPPPPNIID